MFGSAFDKVAGYLDRRLVLTALFPSLVFWGAVLWLVIDGIGWTTAHAWWAGKHDEQRTLLAAAVLIGIVFFASLLSVQIGALTRLYEGYWGRRWPGRQLMKLGSGIQRARHRRLDPADAQDYETRFRTYPRREEDLLPTRLGNVLKSAELYPGDDGRYGMDGVFFWPRLYAVLPDAMRTSLQAARASLDLLLTTSWLGALFTLVAAILSPITGTAWPVWVGSGLLVAALAYKGAVRAAVTFAELVRTAFDLYRGTLLNQLGYTTPASLEEERNLWRNLGQQLYRRGASDPTVLQHARTATCPIKTSNYVSPE